MNTLIKAVMDQSSSSEAQSPSPSPNKGQQPSRKRKNNESTRTDGDTSGQNTKKKKADGTEKQKKKITPRPSSEENKGKENSLGANGDSHGEKASTKKKTSSSKKEKEIAKSHAANEAANNFFKVNSDHYSLNAPSADSNAQTRNYASPLLPRSPLTAHRSQLTMQDAVAVQANSTLQSSSSPPSITPLTSVGLKYSPFNPYPPSDGNMSMLDLLGNSSFDESSSSPDSPEHSLLHSSFDSPPSTVGSLLSQSFAILEEPNSLSDHTSPSSISDTSADQDIDVVEFCQAPQCPNCSLLEEKVRKLEKKLESFSK